MSALDVEALQAEISSDSPSGDDLEYDPEFGELERAAEWKEEQQIGDMVVEAEEPDWKVVQKTSIALLGRSKDIRIIAHLLRSTLILHGIEGFRDGLLILKGLIEEYWETIHPQFDEDDGDPTMRMNALVSLCDESAILRPLRVTPLIQSKTFGPISYRDFAIESGEIAAPEDGNYPDSGTINAAIMDADAEEQGNKLAAVQESIELVDAIDTYVTEQVGAGTAPSFSELHSLLKSLHYNLANKMNDAGLTEEPVVDDAGEGALSAEGGATAKAAALSGNINSRDDVVKALDKIIQYYERNEPASPIPILMIRAKKLVPLGFIDIIKNIAPDGLTEVERIRGPEDDEDDDY